MTFKSTLPMGFLSFLSVGFVLGGGFSDRTLAKAADKSILTLRTFAVDMGSPGPATAQPIDIVIERWSTDEERARLRAALVESGSDKLLSTLQDIRPRAGFIRSGSGPGWDIRYARDEVSSATGVHRIVIATDRPMSYWERTTQPPSTEYEFSLAEIRLGPDGKGEGKLVRAAKVKWNEAEQAVEIENYGTEPVRLNAIRAQVKQ
jgi:hypothetical protein